MSDRRRADGSAADELKAQVADRWRGGDYCVPARVIERVAKDAHRLRIDPVSLIVALELPAVRAGTTSIRGWQTVAIRLGILGTFVGLVLGLPRVAPLLDASTTTSTIAGAKSLVDNLALAFGTSIAGLVAALLLQGQAFLIARQENRLLAVLDAAILDVQNFFLDAIDRSPAVATMKETVEAVDRLRGDLNDATQGIQQATSGVADGIAAQQERFDQQIRSLAQGRDELTALARSQVEQIERMRGLYDHIAKIDERVAALAGPPSRTRTRRLLAASPIRSGRPAT